VRSSVTQFRMKSVVPLISSLQFANNVSHPSLFFLSLPHHSRLWYPPPLHAVIEYQPMEETRQYLQSTDPVIERKPRKGAILSSDTVSNLRGPCLNIRSRKSDTQLSRRLQNCHHRMTNSFITRLHQRAYITQSLTVQNTTCTPPGRMHQVAEADLSETTPESHASPRQYAACSKGVRITRRLRH